MFHAIAYGGSKPTENRLFRQIIAQSPGPQVSKGNNTQLVSSAFLAALNVTNVDDARLLSTETLMQANREVQATLPYFGPFVDGDLIPDLPSRLYNSGRHVPKLRIMAGHNANEARLFIPPSSNSQASFDAFLKSQFPDATNSQIRYINATLYPLPSPLTAYQTQNARLSLLDSDVYNIFWTILLAQIYKPWSHNYIFSIPPAYHAQDLAYTFYNGASYQHDVNVTVARTLQRYITNFVNTGNPNADGLPYFPAQVNTDPSNAGILLNLTDSGAKIASEDAVDRCSWWFETAFAGSN